MKISSHLLCGSLNAAVVMIAAGFIVILVRPETIYGHGFAGSRFFPATLSTDDPFVNDELSLPTVSSIVTPEEGGTREAEISVDIAKRITPNFGIEVGETFTNLHPPREGSVSGFGNLELRAKYEFSKKQRNEALLSLGAEVEVGGTGRKQVGADTFTTWTPAVFFGKGVGDLPGELSFLKPLAVTGLVGVAIPTSASSETVTLNETTGEHEIDIAVTQTCWNGASRWNTVLFFCRSR